MELNNNYTEEFDVFINDYKVVENKSSNNQNYQNQRRCNRFNFFGGCCRNSCNCKNIEKMHEEQNKVLQEDAPVLPPPPPMPPNNNQPLQPPSSRPSEPPRPPMPPQPPRPPAGTRAISLTAQLYYELGNLQSMYSQLAAFAPNENEASILNSYANETLVLRGAMLEIYKTLTGSTLPSTSNQYLTPVLTGVYCTDLVTVYDFASNISTTLLQLIRIIDVNSINRQLAIISATINNQVAGLSGLINNCV